MLCKALQKHAGARVPLRLDGSPPGPSPGAGPCQTPNKPGTQQQRAGSSAKASDFWSPGRTLQKAPPSFNKAPLNVSTGPTEFYKGPV